MRPNRKAVQDEFVKWLAILTSLVSSVASQADAVSYLKHRFEGDESLPSYYDKSLHDALIRVTGDAQHNNAVRCDAAEVLVNLARLSQDRCNYIMHDLIYKGALNAWNSLWDQCSSPVRDVIIDQAVRMLSGDCAECMRAMAESDLLASIADLIEPSSAGIAANVENVIERSLRLLTVPMFLRVEEVLQTGRLERIMMKAIASGVDTLYNAALEYAHRLLSNVHSATEAFKLELLKRDSFKEILIRYVRPSRIHARVKIDNLLHFCLTRDSMELLFGMDEVIGTLLGFLTDATYMPYKEHLCSKLIDALVQFRQPQLARLLGYGTLKTVIVCATNGGHHYERIRENLQQTLPLFLANNPEYWRTVRETNSGPALNLVVPARIQRSVQYAMEDNAEEL